MGKFLRFNNGKYKIYLASLKNSELNLLKIGITQFVDAEDRFNWNYKEYTRGIEPEAYHNLFPEITICDSVIVENKAQAEEIEAKILNGWGAKDFWLESQLSGITELRKYTSQRYAIAKSIITKVKNETRTKTNRNSR